MISVKDLFHKYKAYCNNDLLGREISFKGNFLNEDINGTIIKVNYDYKHSTSEYYNIVLTIRHDGLGELRLTEGMKVHVHNDLYPDKQGGVGEILGNAINEIYNIGD